MVVNSTLDRFGRIDALLISPEQYHKSIVRDDGRAMASGTELKLDGARRLTILAWEALKRSKGSVVSVGRAALDPKPAFARRCN